MLDTVVVHQTADHPLTAWLLFGSIAIAMIIKAVRDFRTLSRDR